jgi:4-hydroxybenzoate polyprenyltransferase
MSARAWIQLLRPPNLFTVPGDPLAGFLLTRAYLEVVHPDGGPSVLWAVPAVAAGLLIYAGGLIANDLFDIGEDRRDRPGRPLPAGHVSPTAAAVAAGALSAAGVGVAMASAPLAGATAGVLALVAWLYDAGLKRVAIVGPVAMGLCRSLSLWVGVQVALRGLAVSGTLLAGPSPLVLGAAIALGAYVAAITALAARETTPHRAGMRRYAPLAVILLWALLRVGTGGYVFLGSLTGGPAASDRIFITLRSWVGLGGLLVVAMSVAWTVRCTGLLRGDPPARPIPPVIGMLLRGLLLLQSAFVLDAAVLADEPGLLVVPAALLLAWPMSAWTSRRFYAS